MTVTQRFWPRPLGSAIEAFSTAGLWIEAVTEARPSTEAIVRFPELASLAEIPSFIVYRLRRAPDH